MDGWAKNNHGAIRLVFRRRVYDRNEAQRHMPEEPKQVMVKPLHKEYGGRALKPSVFSAFGSAV